MKLYLSTIAGTRRRYGWKVRYEWDPTRPMTAHYARTIRRHYRTMRQAGIEEMAARWIIWDIVEFGGHATRNNDDPRLAS